MPCTPTLTSKAAKPSKSKINLPMQLLLLQRVAVFKKPNDDMCINEEVQLDYLPKNLTLHQSWAPPSLQ